MRSKSTDVRARRSRQALLDAFIGLVLTRAYDDITVQDVARRAGVGRSTLYEHFPGKTALYAASLANPFGTLADAVGPLDNTRALVSLLEHFWGNRTLARRVFTGAMRERSVAVLVLLIEQRLRAAGPGLLIVPPRLAAIQLAEALFAPVAAWLTAQAECPAPRLARALRATAVALTTALRAGSAEVQRRHSARLPTEAPPHT